MVRSGSTKGKRIALTFDDGPSPYTSRILRILDRAHIPGTFFALGSQVRGRAALLRDAAEDGHEIANHSWRHSFYPGFSDLRSTSRALERASGFQPCSFRPPGGALSRATVSAAAQNRMRTVLWSVDPRDWTTPGTSVIAARAISGARPGGIILLHDGGGPRGQTVAALPRVISELRRRGYSFTTVHRLLGGRTLYQKVR